MVNLTEAIGAPSALGSDLHAGVESISSNQTVLFTKYVRVILPLDGYTFWVKADKVGPSALLNAALLNKVRYNQLGAVVTPAPTLDAKGSLHYATDTRQEEATSLGINRVVFTSEQEITDLNQIGPSTLFIGVIDGVKFAFSTRGSFYRQSGLWHYVGAAVYADMDSQVVDDPRMLNTRDVIVSNSLPLWLAFNGYIAPYGFSNPGVTLFPSFLVPGNLPPPYGAVHIGPDDTRSLTSAPRISPTDSSHSQLCSDRVRVTLFGMRNFNALDFVDCVLQKSLDYDEFGIMNIPVPRDDKRTQSELNTIAQKKIVSFEISYYQNRMNDIAQQLILSAIPTYEPNEAAAA